MKNKIKQLLLSTEYGSKVSVKGWVRTKRDGKNVTFIALNDGSTVNSIQIVAEPSKISDEVLKQILTGAAICVNGILIQSAGKGQNVEVQAEEIIIYGTADATFPLQKKEHTFEFLREIAHLRPRTNTFSSIFRIRHHAAFAIHKYFNDNGFYYLHTPIVTGSDCEGAGAMFRVTTLDLEKLPKTPENKIDFTQDFFAKETYLTVSGQLEGELGATALSLVYTFGPTFRAENSNTPRHLAEFWMIEPEMAFYEINENMDLAEDFLKYVIKYVMDNCADDIAFLAERFKKEQETKKKEERSEFGLIEKLQFVLSNSFERITYTKAIEILETSDYAKKGKFEFPVKWGIDLQREHEVYLVEKHFKRPVIITDYPRDIKAFYMKQNDDGKTVRGMDVLFPIIGEIIGGSQREENLEKLMRRMTEMHIGHESMQWYLDTRKYGTVPHSGFGLGFERLLLFLTGMGNIRDVIPFPRTPQNAEF